MATDFDNWLNKNGKGIFDQHDIWGSSYFDELRKTILAKGNIDAFIERTNQNLKNEYIAEKSEPFLVKINDLTVKINHGKNFQKRSLMTDAKLDRLKVDIGILLNKYPPEKHFLIQSMLSDYATTGKINGKLYTELTREPNSFLKRFLKRKKLRNAKLNLDAFVRKYQKINLVKEIRDLQDLPCKNFGSNDLAEKFNAIVNFNVSYANLCSHNFKNNFKNLEENIDQNIKSQEELQSNINRLETQITQSSRLPAINEIIRHFVNDIREEIKNPPILNSADYVECLGKLSDNEIIMFNIGLRDGKGVANKINHVLQYNGLECGNATNQWLIRKDTEGRMSDIGKFELFSPLMTAKEAREVMPKLMYDLDRANISSGLAVPIKASEMFKDNPFANSQLSEAELMNFIGSALTKQNIDNPWYSDENMQKLGISSKEDLPTIYKSLDELKNAYSKEQCLFSGTTASDDYLPFSARVGRNGIVYATPDISYAALYDGLMRGDTGNISGKSATGDKYVSVSVGKLSGKDVNIGFINVYAQNQQDDKYFCNFGMEDYRQNKNKMITREEALFGPGSVKAYQDAETYVTSEKNPLKAKIMHIEWNGNEFFMPVPNQPNATILKILNNRQAKMVDTFSHNAREDILARLQTQKEEFAQGKIYQLRDKDFALNKKTILATQPKSEQTNATPQNKNELYQTLSQTNTEKKLDAPTIQPKIESRQAISIPPKVISEQTTSTPSAEKVADMSKKEKGNFFHKLRLGINTILAKAEAQLSPEKTVSQTKVQIHTPQKPNIAQMKMAKDRGKSI